MAPDTEPAALSDEHDAILRLLLTHPEQGQALADALRDDPGYVRAHLAGEAAAEPEGAA